MEYGNLNLGGRQFAGQMFVLSRGNDGNMTLRLGDLADEISPERVRE